MDDRKPVELVRVPREEQYFDREEVLGRDLTSVFPTESKKAAIDGAGLAELLGAGNRKFISETELEAIKTKRGLTVEDGTLAPDKPLTEVLREAKEAKEAAFQDQWKQMKQGKNRPLDEDEFHFVDSIADAEAAAARRRVQEEEEELAAFYAAQRGQQRGAAVDAAAEGTDSIVGPANQQPSAGAGPLGRQQEARRPAGRAQQPAKKPLLAIKPILRAVEKAKSAGDTAPGGSNAQPAAKRQRVGDQEQRQEGSGSESDGPGLAGLLGGYGSEDSDS